MIEQIIKVDENDIRIDKFLVNYLKISRNKVNQLFLDELIYLNNKKINKLGIKVYLNDLIEIRQKDNLIENKNEIISYKYDLKIYYEDEYFLIVYKPSGMLSHETSFHETNTLINALKYKYPSKDKFFLVHRLDKDTSGLLIIAKSESVQVKLQSLFLNNLILKKYYAIVHHWFSDTHLLIDVPICRSYQQKLLFQANEGKNCKNALTEVFLLQNLENNLALVNIILHTGRTHQIRVHLKYINHPIVNDPLYSNDEINNKYHQYLMNYYLKFNHPYINKEIEIKIDFDQEFLTLLNKLGYINN